MSPGGAPEHQKETPMVTHVVCWKVKEEAEGMDKAAILDKMKTDLEALPGHIDDILSLTVGVNEKASDAASDVVLLSSFADWEALSRYQEHPVHQKVVAFVKNVVTERRVVDFED
jgi:hypothetical protein